MRAFQLLALTVLVAADAQASRPRPPLSEDRELQEIDIEHWDCRNKPEGTAKLADGKERNRLKNRSMPEGGLPESEQTETAGFLRRLADFEAKTKGLKRDVLNPDQRRLLETLEKKIVTMTGYLGLAYAGPPETCNCGESEFHDWHLEVYEKPPEHPPQPGDPTPIVCEITPRTQNAIFRSGIRIQELTAFFRHSDGTYEPTGHKAQRIRVTGYLLWDDDHNGAGDIGTAIRMMGGDRHHHPWRSVAWEIHPVLKVERLDGVAATGQRETTPINSLRPSPTPAQPSPEPTAYPTATASAIPTATPPRIVTLLRPVRIRIPYGETVLPRGVQLPVVAHDANNVTVQYMGQNQVIPISSTDYH